MAIADFPYSFASQPIIDPTTGQPVLNATGGVLVHPRTGASLPIADMNGNAIASISGNAYGQSQQFRSTALAVLVKFGSVFVQAPSIEMFDLVQTATDAVSLSQTAQSAAASSASSAATSAAAAQAAGGGGGAVSSVAGRTGAVTVTKTDVGLSNVDNTADANKPVSAAQSAAIAAKPDDSLVVHKALAETITGVKTFTVSPVVPTPVNPTDAANRQYVLDNAGTGGGTGGAVSSVNTRTGAVVLTKTDVGLANADNTSDANKPLSTAETAALALKAPLASPTFTGTVTVPTPTATGAATPKSYVDTAVAGVSGGGGGTFTPIIDPTNTAYAGGMGTARTAAQNGAALQAAIIAANGKTVKPPAGDYPCSGAAITDQDVNLDLDGVFLLQPQGVDSCLVIERTPAAPITVGATYVTWWGPWTPSGVTVGSLMQVIPGTGLNRFKGGRVYLIESPDRYPWGWSALNLYNAGDAPVYTQTDGLPTQSEQFPLLGIGMVVNGVSVTAAPLEQMTVQGATSGATGLVQSRLFGNANGGITATQAHITFTSVSGDFTVGETLTRIAGGNPVQPPTGGSIAAVGASVGTVASAPVLLTTDIFVLQYGRVTAAQAAPGTSNTPVRTDNSVHLREIDTNPICIIRNVGIDVVGAREDPDTYVSSSNRAEAIEMRGVYAPQVSYRVRNSWTRALAVWSSYMPRIDCFVDQQPNHADLSQSAFAYGLELKSGCKAARITLHGHTVRHLFTTNPNQRTYAAANDFSSGKWTQWDYGTPIRTAVVGAGVESAFAAGMDTHPGDYYTTFENVRIHGGGSGGRYNTDNNSAFSSRGFGTKWKNCEVDDSAVGFYIDGVAHDAGFNHRYQLENCNVHNALAACVLTSTAMVPGQATVEIVGGSYSHRLNYPKDVAGTSEPTRNKYNQFSVLIGSGVNVDIRGDARFRRFGLSWLRSLGSGTVNIYSALADYTETPTQAQGAWIDAGAGNTTAVKVFDLKVHGSPTSAFVNQSGNSSFQWGSVRTTSTTTTLLSTTAGTPTQTQMTALAGGGGGSGSGTQVTVDGAAVSTLDINSTPTLAIAADVAAPAAATTLSNLSQFQTALTVGSYIVEAELYYTSSVASGGALRFGLGGSSIAGASITNVKVDQYTSTTASTVGYLNVLGQAGTAAVTTVGSANAVGVSSGVTATTLPVIIKGRLVVTTAGTYGIVWHLSSGATTTAVLKAGSYVSFTKMS